MKKKQNKIIFSGDIFIITVILAAAAVSFYFSKIQFINLKNNEPSDIIATVYKDGKEYKVIALSEIESGYNLDLENAVIRVESGKIRYLHSTCSEKHCINTGWIEHVGESAVCVPLRTAIVLNSNNSESTIKETGGKNEIDAIAG